MFISVCIPAFRSDRRHLSELLESINSQSRIPDEVVISEDPSSAPPLREMDLPRLDTPLRLSRSEERLGMVSNWNRAVELSDGDVIILTGHDDLFRSNACAFHLETMEVSGAVLSASRVGYIDNVGSVRRTNQRSVSPDRLLQNLSSASVSFDLAVRLALIYGNVPGEPCGTAFSREAFLSVGGYDPAFQHSSDLDFVLRITSSYKSFQISSTCVSLRRLHSENATRQHVIEGIASADRQRLFDRYACHLMDSKYVDRAKGRLVSHNAYDALRNRSVTQFIDTFHRVQPGLIPALAREFLENCGWPPEGRHWL
jgi:glycosyltransferase involved in cell wall biosynthesis